jgi:hypothetical protein
MIVNKPKQPAAAAEPDGRAEGSGSRWSPEGGLGGGWAAAAV